MKPLYILALALIVSATAHAQTKQDTLIHLQPTEAKAINNQIQQALVKIHKMHIDALVRDSLDNYLIGVQRFLEQKIEAVKPKEVKKGGKP